MKQRVLLGTLLVVVVLGCKPRKWEEASGVLDADTPVEIMQCVAVDDGSKRYRFEILALAEAGDHDKVDFRLSDASGTDDAPEISGRGDLAEDGSYSLVFDGGALTLESKKLLLPSETAETAQGLLSLDFADASVDGEAVTCSRLL